MKDFVVLAIGEVYIVSAKDAKDALRQAEDSYGAITPILSAKSIGSLHNSYGKIIPIIKAFDYKA
jgi:hypothetical protein